MKKTKDIYSMEEYIMHAWYTVDDIKMMHGEDSPVAAIADARFQKLWAIFEEVLYHGHSDLEKEVKNLRSNNASLRDEVKRLEETVAPLEDENAGLYNRNDELRDEVKRLEETVAELEDGNYTGKK